MSRSAKLHDFLIAQMRRMLLVDFVGTAAPSPDKVDAVFRRVFFYDCDKAFRDLPLMLPTPPKIPLLPAPRSDDDALADFAPSLDFLRRMKFAYSKYDVATLDPMDAVDFERELAWCDDWLDWYSRH